MGENIKAPDTLLPALLQRLRIANAATAVEEKQEQTNETGWQARVQAAHKLRAERDALKLMPAFTDPDEAVRLAAVQVCADWGKQAPMQQLLSSLHDPSSLVRQATIFTLDTLDSEVARQRIKEAQFDPSPIVREAALQVMIQRTESGETSIPDETTPFSKQKRVAESQAGYVFTSAVNNNNDATKNSIEMDRLTSIDQDIEIIPIMGKTPHSSVSKRKKHWHRPSALVAAILLFGLLGSWLVVSYLPGIQTAKDSGTPLWTYSGSVGSNSISWSADSSQLSFGTQPYTLNTYNVTTRKLDTYPAINTARQVQADNSKVMATNFSPDARYLVGVGVDKTGNAGQLHIWDTRTGQLLASYPYYQPASYQSTHGSYAISSPMLSWSKDNASMATVDGKGNLIVWHTQTAQHIISLKSSHGTFDKVTWSQDNKTLAVTTISGYLEIWNSLTQKRITSGFVGNQVQTLTLSPDAHYAATGDFSNTVSILDIQSGKVINHQLPIAYGKAGNLSWSSDSRYMILFKNGGGDNKLSTLVWDIAHDKKVFETQSSALVSSVLSPDGRDVAVANPDNQQINIWEIATGRKVTTHKGKMGPNNLSLNWSPNGKYITSTYQDNQVQLWDAQNGQDITTYDKQKGQVLQIILWSPNGAYIAILTIQFTQMDVNSSSVSSFKLAIWSVPTH